MTNEEMEKTIQFILEQQAQFAAERQQVREQLGKLTDAVITVTGVVGKIGEAQARTDERVAELAEAQTRTNANVAELAEKGKETEERLNAFIVVVERYISEGRNGK